MFVYTREGYINLNHVTRITTSYLSSGVTRYHFHGPAGDILGSDDQDLDIDLLTAPVVPAAPGETVHLIYAPNLFGERPADGDAWVEEVAVVAWRCSSAGAHPVTHEAISSNVTILRRDGSGHFIAPGDQTYKTVDEALAAALRHAQESWDQRSARCAEGSSV